MRNKRIKGISHSITSILSTKPVLDIAETNGKVANLLQSSNTSSQIRTGNDE